MSRVEHREIRPGTTAAPSAGAARLRARGARRRRRARLPGMYAGPEKRQAHDVIPVHVRHEQVIRLRRRRAVARDRRLAERPQAAAQVADHVFRRRRFRSRRRTCGRRTCRRPRTAGRRRIARSPASESNVRPDAPRSAATIFARTPARSAPPAASRACPRTESRFIEGLRASAPRRTRRAPSGDIAASASRTDGKHFEHRVEAADREDLGDDRLQRRRRRCAPCARASASPRSSARASRRC